MVREWIGGYLARLRVRFAPGDWPEPGSEEFGEWVKGWVTALSLKQVSEREASLAAESLLLAPPNFRREWIPRVVAEIESNRSQVGAPAATREAAQLASRNCEHCGGMGLAIVWHPRPNPADRIPETVAAHCVCQHGRWMRRRLTEQDAELVRRIPDFADVQEGRSLWLSEPPEPVEAISADEEWQGPR
jgi:hypothetical protein